jgi:hypothetical protein
MASRCEIAAVSLALTKMAELHFTSWLRELVPDGPLRADGATVGDVLTTVFVERPHVRSYLLDDRGRLRKHVCVFADGVRLPQASTLDHGIRPQSKLYVMQALSGG